MDYACRHLLIARNLYSLGASCQALILIDNGSLNDEAKHHLSVTNLADKQVVVFLNACPHHALPILLSRLITVGALQLLWELSLCCHRFRILALQHLMLTLELVWVLKLGGYHQHDCLGAGWDLDNIGLDTELYRALGLRFDTDVRWHGVLTTDSRPTDSLGSVHETEIDFKLMLAQVLERDAEFLKSPDIFHSDGDNLLLQYTLSILVHQDFIVENLRLDHLLTNQLWNLDLTGE